MDRNQLSPTQSAHTQEAETSALGIRAASFGHQSRWRRFAIAVALAGLLGGVVGAGGVALFDRQPLAPSPPATTSPNVPALLAKVLPGVVSIHTSLATGGQGAGTGMVITSDGEVLTNAHVVSGATTITVTRYGTSRALAARLVGASPEDDLALLHIDSQENLPTVSLGTSADVPVGAFVVAVGNALGLSAGTPSATEGIISAEGRSITNDQDGQAVTLENLFQTDAAINPGNSGGPLFSSDGRVIGINTAVAGAAEGIGFAIPVDQAKDLLAHLRAGGMTGTPLAFLGVEGVSLTPAIADAYGLLASAGVVVFRVVAGSPADAAGLLPDDVVVAIDGAPVNDAIQLRRLVASSKVGQRLQLQIVRGADTTTFTVTLGSAPLGTS